jgi:hypothetical protein
MENNMVFTKGNVYNVIEAEGQIDTFTEAREVNAISPRAYQLFRKALAQLQDDCEAQGIFGHWQSDTSMKVDDWIEKEIDQPKEIA